MSPPPQPATTAPAGDDYLSIKGACERYGMSRSGVYELIRQHRLRKYRKAFDSRTYIRVADLEAVRTTMPSQQRELIR